MSEPAVTEVRSPFNLKGLEAFLSSNNKAETSFGSHVPQFQAPMSVKQFKFGQSNPTYLLQDSRGRKVVLRRKPSENSKLVSKSAHAIEREFFMLKGIQRCNDKAERLERKVPIAEPYLLCEDESVIGFVFYLMDYVTGIQVRNPSMPGASTATAEKYWDSIMETILAIHSLDPDTLISQLPAKHFPQFQPEKLKKTSGTYFQRQVRTLKAVAQLQNQLVKPIANFDNICEWLLKHAPNDPSKRTLIHGDFKIDNVLFDEKTSKVAAVLDWELCTFGHPLFDLANFLQPFQLPNKLNLLLFKPDQTTMGKENPGSIETVHEKLKLYQLKLGYNWNESDPSNNPLDNWDVGYVFGLLRLCVISQGIAMRVAKGSASSANASGYANLYHYLSTLAMEAINESTSPESKL